ncbi:hypothetical protein [Qipengyuania zhejiangensis]|uniref:hypothetical protein n=1 Tax=Qipengyuania zhejiangensis TaxID=3077782 RepID=UPI002D790A70|nr:hypothetical protein [Qipengyuania sp. Z2]
MQTSGLPRRAGRLAFTAFAFGVLAGSPAVAQQSNPLAIHDDGDTRVTATLDGGVNAVAEQNLYWNLADKFAPSANFDSDAEWLEAYVKPGINFEQDTGGESQLYGRVSGVASTTLGTDAFSQSDTGRVTLEEAYVGFRTGTRESGQFDVSVGARELKLGTGMLISNGASNGFERGAVKLGPRKAWERSVIAAYRKNGFALTGFYIDPNELESNNTGTRIAGADARIDRQGGDYAGLSYINVLRSGAPYPQAAPGGLGPPAFLDGGRDGLNAITLYTKFHPLQSSVKGLYVALDGAYEWNDRIRLRAWGGRFQLGHLWAQSKWRPELFYTYQRFSGDDPDTATLERFDPLNYEGSPASWATGSKSALVFINSNVQSHQLTLKLMPSPKDFLTFRTAHIRVDELRSPIQFGQATRLEIADGLGSVISGVTNGHLADDFFVEYTHLLNQNIFVTAGASVSTPGKGIKVASGGDAPSWTGGFVNLVVKY